MKKNVLLIVLAVVLVWAGISLAEPESFSIALNVPAANSIVFTLFKIDNGEFPETAEGAHDVLNFGDLELDSQYGVFRPVNGRYFAIDIGTDGAGVGSPDQITFNYTEGNNPNKDDGGNGLSHKGKITIAKAIDGEDDVVLDKRILAKAGASVFSKTSFTGGWPRIYVGVNSGDEDDVTYPNLEDAEVFSLADTPGAYTGVLEISATIN